LLLECAEVGRLGLNTSEAATAAVANYDVGVAIFSVAQDRVAAQGGREAPGGESIPGYDEALGRRRELPVTHIARGEEAVRAATEAIASQIGIAARRIATAIGQQPAPDSFLLDEVEVSFGVSLAAGIQTLFTATAESSAQVTVRLSRRPVAEPQNP
jgi:hypothetical protein